MEITDYAVNTIDYFRSMFIPKKTEINYSMVDDKTIKMKIPKDLFNEISSNLEKDEQDFEVIPSERKIELKYPRHNGKRLLKTSPFIIDIYFVDHAALKTVESIQDKVELNIRTWSDFFETIDPEYKNLFKHIIDNIVVAVHKNEYNKIISKKSYHIDYRDGLFEKKEKFVNDEWRITYQPVTSNLYQVFRMFFKFFDEIPLEELADFNKFKEIVEKTKYKNHLSNK